MKKKLNKGIKKGDKLVLKGVVKVDRSSVTWNKFRETDKVSKLPMTKKRLAMIRQSVNALLESNGNKLMASELLNISERALYSRFQRYPVILKQVEEFNKMTVKLAREKLNSNALISANEVIKIASAAKSDNTRLTANLEVLDRAGIAKPQTNNNIQVNVLNKLREDIKEFDI